MTIDTASMQARATDAAALLKALGHPDRLVLLCALASGEACVSELEKQLGLRQPSLSQQLTVLRNEALVTTRREGKHIFYRLTSPVALSVLQVLQQHYCPTTSGATCP